MGADAITDVAQSADAGPHEIRGPHNSAAAWNKEPVFVHEKVYNHDGLKVAEDAGELCWDKEHSRNITVTVDGVGKIMKVWTPRDRGEDAIKGNSVTMIFTGVQFYPRNPGTFDIEVSCKTILANVCDMRLSKNDFKQKPAGRVY